MKNLIATGKIALVLLAATPIAAHAATAPVSHGHGGHGTPPHKISHGHAQHGGGSGGGTTSVPELDLGVSGAAVMLLAGGAMVFNGRRRRTS